MPHFRSVSLLALLPLSLALGAFAGDMATADRIEEDWEVVVARPDPALTSPQISTTMKVDPSPVCVFNLNYRDSPSFVAGGLQVKVRDGDQAIATASRGSAQFGTSDESVTWTQRLSLAGGNLSYEVTSGRSTTWGNFGGSADPLTVSAATSMTSLANYDPDASVRGSGPSFGSNRVTSMTLLRIRYYRGQTLLSTDETPRPVKLSN